ncbi:2-oxo-hepta-3-ene-1,7-dioic acid hydratase [Azospirillum sp. YIM B02556]|uniref:2-oxo-hepta-3-ene-1,7-dioic acid hydratase n=1 Tax=Azospirillum endophyticum TaxID=2800326 RepID=A0ABS1F7A8_9PROT|nr:2-oxo-hepta-3-ene-1,7-dioic acid hydratase [Azospirillum endophyticum]MBK1839162.1 2-oxo-hepta-3-ene-1,7-dioic acid hydratase [Azospirillum endophyticum]
MLPETTIAGLARRLDDAERTGTPLRMFTREHPEMTLRDAYAVQRAWADLKIASGRVVKGHKIGLTSRAMQIAVGIDEPDYGVLFDDMVHHDGDVIAASRYREPRVEVELAFILDKPLRGPGCTLYDVLDATRYVTPALEILDARMHRRDPETGAGRTVVDTISDNAANAALVLGGRPVRPAEADLRWIAALLFRNGRIEETGVAAGVLNNPAMGIAWLVDKLAAHGESLAAGEIVLAGSFTRPIDVTAGDTIHADYGPYGSVSCRFS